MTRLFCLLTIILIAVGTSFSQPGPSASAAKAPAAVSPLELARATRTAHGGESLRTMRSLIMRGTVDVTGAFSQVIPATFSLVISGDKYAFELNNPIQPLKQVFDGTRQHSTGYELPPVTSLGFPLLARIDQDGYVIGPLDANRKKKQSGFRITTPEGYYTDFLINEKDSRLKGYESSYDVNGRLVTTSVEIDEFQAVEGVTVPKRYSQRFDLGQMTVYASFKSREILVNTDVPAGVFAVPN